MTALEAYKKRLAIQTLRPSAGMKLNHQELRREKDLFVRYPAWLKNRDRTKNDEKQSLYSLVRAFCHTEVEGGCSWQEANKLLYEFRQPHDGMKMDMIKEWVLPTAVLKQSTPTELNSKCKELTSFPSSLEFIRDYVSKSVPFVVKGGLTEHWAAVRKWDLEYLNRTVGKEDVKLYISLDGDFEKVQTYREWEENIHDLVEVMAPDGSSSKHTGNTSSSSAAAMTDPDFDPEERLLIRPAETVFTFAEFVYLSLFYPNKEQASFYLQKHDLRLWKDFTGLMQDISPFLFGERAGSTAPNKTKVKTMSKSKKIKSDKSKGKTGKRGAVPTAGDDVELSSVSSVDATETIDIEANGFGFSHFLQLQYFLFWAGVGTNRGPVHFDENENLFAMVKGKKTWIMFHPSESKQMYELNAEFRSAHLLFEIDLTKTDIGGGSGSNSKTIRGGRADSVIPSSAAVSAAPVGEYFSLPVSSTEKSFQPFSPVNVTHPDYTIHPLFQQAHRVTCEIEAGDVLYLPSNWWHEVASEGDAGDGLSIGKLCSRVCISVCLYLCM